MAETFAAEGAHIGLCARDADQVEQALQAIQSENVQVHGTAVDIADQTALRAWIETVAGQLNGIDVLIANPSAFGVGASPEEWKLG